MVNQFQSISRNVAQPRGDFNDLAPLQPSKSIFGQITTSLLSFMFERGKNERPIGISQLTPKTFQAVDGNSQGVFFRNNRRTPDFRFNKLSQFQPNVGQPQQF